MTTHYAACARAGLLVSTGLTAFIPPAPRVRLFAGAGIAALALSAAGAPLAAQDQQADNEEEEILDQEVDTSEAPPAIIVSGSRIRRDANLDSVAPVISVSADEILDDGSVSLGDALNDLPALRATFNTSNSQRFIGTSGLNFLDLRGLGTTRTLTLVNGRRHITSSIGDFRIDVNTIPNALLEQVDVVTGGSSAVYGSDAIAGVVNFILRDDYEGLELNALTSLSDRGDGHQFGIEGVWGKNFADGRGNVTIAAEYTRSDTVLNSQRPNISGFGIGFTGFVVNPDDPDNEDIQNPFNGVPDQILVSNQRLDFLSDGGTIQNFCVADQSTSPLNCDPLGLERRFRFGPNGRLFDEVTTQFPANGRATDGGGSILADGSLLPEVERITVNLLSKFEISQAFRPFFEFKYARIESFAEGTPSFFNSFCGGLGGATGLGGAPACAGLDATTSQFFISLDNPFLNPADAARIADVQNELLGEFNVGPAATGFFLNRNNVDFGTRNDELTRQTYRLVAGLEGDISNNTRYELSFNYGRFETDLTAQNDLIFRNTRAALDSVALADGSIVCRVNADADTANDIPGCVPLNPFGQGAPSQEALNFINTTSQLNGEAEQYNILGFIATDSSGLFELPGGPIGLVVGGEWRRETAFEQPDEFSAGGNTFFNAFDVFDPPALEVLEAFGEIQIPVLKGTPFFEELTFQAAGRISDYNSGAGSTGTVEAWNISGVWAPIDDVRFRANLSRAIRSPTLNDLFSPQTVNFLFFDDPCDVDFIDQGNAANRAANCAAAGVPVGFDEDIQGNRAVLQGGNELLQAETSDSFTAGVIFQPSFIPGLSFSVDYYDIEVESVIATVGPQAILNNCFDAVDLNNTFCNQILPRQADGSLDPAAALITGPVNFASLTAEGIDFDLRYSKTFDNGHRLTLRAIATHVLDRTNFLDTDNPEVPDDDRGELGDPIWAANFNIAYTIDEFTLAWTGRFIGEQFIGARENYRSSTVLCPNTGIIPATADSAACTPGELVTAPPLNPDAFPQETYPSLLTHDVRLDIQATDEFRFTIGVDNLTDELPPFGLTGGGAGSGIFDNRGRTFFASFRAEI